MFNQVIQGDCLIKLKELEDNSVDSIVTDPPYELGFMGKSWDNTGIANNVEMWKECLRVLKPGGHLLAFSGTRTYHRMASAIEDAGFEIRDMIEWVYGSGFPKSLNIGKAVDKIAEVNQEIVNQKKECGLWIKEARERFGYSINQVAELGKFYGKVNHGGSVSNWELGQLPVWNKFVKLKEILNLDSRYDYLIEDRPKDYIPAEREIIGKRITGAALSGQHKGTESTFAASGTNEVDITKGTSEWEGWGTALKPAHEPICMARKPLAEKTVAENCLKYGTGGINIDESRVEFDAENENFGKEVRDYGEKAGGQWQKGKQKRSVPQEQGRFPANLIHDNSEEVRECFPDSKSPAKRQTNSWFPSGDANGVYGEAEGYGDSGNASRFFKSIIYQAKASKSERNNGCEEPNRHPTIKPIALMEYLIKMVTPKGGIVLDPFAGSGSTLVAAKQNGFQYIGIEMTEEYIPIIEARLK